MVPRVRRAEETELLSLHRLFDCLGTGRSRMSSAKGKGPTFAALEKKMLAMLTEVKRSGSLPSTLEEVSRIGGTVRERLSADMMLLIGQLRTAMRHEGDATLAEYSGRLTACLELLSAFSGMERENINRGSGWLFMSLGRRLERAIYLARELRVITRPLAEGDWSYLECLLEVADSSMTYRARYYTTLQPLAVLDVLMADETNPRSLDFQLSHLVDLYGKLPRHVPEDLQAMGNALAGLRGMDLQGIEYPRSGKAGRGANGVARLDRFLAELESLLPSWSNNLSSRYFSHARTLPIAMGHD